MKNLNVQELSVEDQKNIDGGVIALIIGSGLALMAMAYQFGKDAAERERR